MARASFAVLQMGLPRVLKDVLMRAAIPVRRPTARSSAWSQGSSVPSTDWWRAVPSRWPSAGDFARAASRTERARC